MPFLNRKMNSNKKNLTNPSITKGRKKSSKKKQKLYDRFLKIGTCERVFTREISSRDETCPGIKSSLSMVKCLFVFTRFCRDEISSRDELIPVKKTVMKFHPGDEKKKKRRVNTSSRDEILK